MKLLLYSDLHAHPFKPYATILPNGMNSRLADVVACLQQILEFCIANPWVDAVLFGGDLFHTRGRLNVQAFNAIFEVMAGFSIRKIPHLLIHGNHDQADKEGSVYSIHTLRTMVQVVDQPGWQLLEGRNGGRAAIMAVPYTENVAHLRELVKTPCPFTSMVMPRLFLGHMGIQGAKIGSDFVYTSPYDATVADLNLGAFDYGFLGHYHLHQKLASNACYIGAPLHHNWGDKDDPNRGFLIYDTETRKLEQEVLKSPRFIEVEASLLKQQSALQGLSEYAQDGIVRVVDDRTWSDDECEEMRDKLGARVVEIVPVVGKVTTRSTTRVAITPGMGYPELLQKCIERGVLSLEDGLDPDYLVMLGSEILAEVEDGQ